MKENNMMSYEMYEDFKETMVKAIKSEIAALVPTGQPTDTDLSQQLEQIVLSEHERHRAIITQLTDVNQCHQNPRRIATAHHAT